MWAEALGEAARGAWLAALVVCLGTLGAPAAAHLAARARQHDLHALPHGCRSTAVNLEARSLAGWSTSRHCVVARLQDISVDQFLDIRSKAGALLVLMPEKLNELSTIEKEHLLLLESAMSAQEIMIPVYFVPWSSDLDSIVRDLSTNFVSDDKSNSALDNLMNLALANGYQIVISGANSQKQESKVATLHGQLMGQETLGKTTNIRDNSKLPTVAIVAHYDSSAIAPEMAFGADSNGSGVSVLLELARIFSQLYSTPSTRGPVNLVFLLTGAAYMNYYSTKKWIEDQLDSVEGSIIQDASFVLCLDSLASDGSIVMHVSKPPKDGSPTNLFYDQLKQAAAIQGNINIDGIHKKINLADENLAWEHERFSIRRLPAFTLSSLRSHKSLTRSSLIDNYDSVDIKTLTANAQVIADALAGYLYNVSTSDYSAIFSGSLKTDPNSIEAWMRYLTSQPRATQFVSHVQNPIISILSEALGKYIPDLGITYYSPDKRDPEFSTYTPTSAMLNIYNVKPAIFDLFLTVAIVMYLGVVYLFIFKFPFVYHQVCKMTICATKSYKVQ